MNVIKTKVATDFVRYLFVGLAIATSPLLLAGLAYAAPIDSGGAAKVSSVALGDTIAAKCDFAADRYKGNKDGSNYKDFRDACAATGEYFRNGDGLNERAKRLLVICGHKGILKTSKYDAYSKRGVSGYTDCDKVKKNKDIKDLAGTAYTDTGSGSSSTSDPALDCGPNDSKCDLMAKYVNPFIGFLAAFVGIGVVIAIVSGGLRYITAADDPQKVAAARTQIRGAIIALICFIFLYAAIRWLLPS